MAMTSGLYLLTIDTLTSSGGYTGWTTGIEADTHKIRLFSDTYTPNHATDHAVGATGEVSGGSWASGASNPVLSTAASGGSTSPTWGITGTGEASILTYDMADVVVATSNFTGATGCVIWADAATAPTADPMIVSVAFGSTASPNGTFTIQWNASGIFTWDLIP